jgi:hypothetical protein
MHFHLATILEVDKVDALTALELTRLVPELTLDGRGRPADDPTWIEKEDRVCGVVEHQLEAALALGQPPFPT